MSQKGRDRRQTLQSLDFMQTMFLIYLTQTGVGLFSLPRLVVQEANQDAWMSVIIAGAAVNLLLYVMIVLMRYTGGQELYVMFRQLFGKVPGLVLGGIFAIYCLLSAAGSARAYVELIQSWLFDQSQLTWVLLLLLLMPGYYCATGGVRTLGRFAVFVFFFTIWMLFLDIYPGLQINSDYYRPMFDASFGELFKAAYQSGFSFLGAEMLLLVYPYIQNKKKALLAVSLGNGITTFVYVVLTMVCIGYFGQNYVKELVYPALDLHKIVQLPMIERIEQIIVAVTSALTISTFAVYVWGAGRFLTEVTKWPEHKAIRWTFPALYLLALLPGNYYQLDVLQQIVIYAGLVVMGGLPLFLLAAAFVKRTFFSRKDKGGEQEKPEAS